MSLKTTFLALLCLAALGTVSAMAQEYQFTDVGMPDSYYQFGIPRWGGPSEVYGINNAGTAVGEMSVYDNTTSSTSHMHALVWSQGNLQDLGTLAGDSTSVARGINEAGTIVGTSGSRAVVWQGGVGTALNTLGGTWSTGYGINDSGQVVGQAETASGESHAFLFNGSLTLDLGTLGGSTSIAYGINNLGQVVGQSMTASGDLHAFLWINGVMTDLGTLGGPSSSANGINDAGQIVGTAESSTPSQWNHAFLWQNGSMTDLTPGDSSIGVGLGINEEGVAVGRIGSPGRAGSAFMWPSASAIGWILALGDESFNSDFQDINDAGQIVGSGYYQSSLGYGNRGFILSPVPEPSGIALFGVSLGVLAIVYRRRRSVPPVACK